MQRAPPVPSPLRRWRTPGYFPALREIPWTLPLEREEEQTWHKVLIRGLFFYMRRDECENWEVKFVSSSRAWDELFPPLLCWGHLEEELLQGLHEGWGHTHRNALNNMTKLCSTLPIAKKPSPLAGVFCISEIFPKVSSSFLSFLYLCLLYLSLYWFVIAQGFAPLLLSPYYSITDVERLVWGRA